MGRADDGDRFDDIGVKGALCKKFEPTKFFGFCFKYFDERRPYDLAFLLRIGDTRELWDLPREKWPEGTEVTGCVLPRLALGLTRGGSLVGLFGYSVQT